MARAARRRMSREGSGRAYSSSERAWETVMLCVWEPDDSAA